jgi:hypothetical protein
MTEFFYEFGNQLQTIFLGGNFRSFSLVFAYYKCAHDEYVTNAMQLIARHATS